MILRFKELKKLEIHHLEIHIDYLLDILRFLGNMKTLNNIDVSLGVINELDEEATKDIFNDALEIINEKFPFPDVRILELEIFEDNNYRQDYRYSIIYGESGPVLEKHVKSDSESDTSDSESDTSGSMDEGNESSDDMDESVENSDTEDISVLE